jgi:hypothetical protein
LLLIDYKELNEFDEFLRLASLEDVGDSYFCKADDNSSSSFSTN